MIAGIIIYIIIYIVAQGGLSGLIHDVEYRIDNSSNNKFKTDFNIKTQVYVLNFGL